MKITVSLFILVLITHFRALAQEPSAAAAKKWNMEAEANGYFMPDDFFILPVFKADKNKLHLEARYNYEDRQTASTWIGYNMTGGKKIDYTITPMIGAIVGISNGVAPGIEMTFTYKKFEVYTESEYLFDFSGMENNFFYTWSDIAYSPRDWFWIGISGQRTRLYQTDLDIQRGLMAGAALKNWNFTSYVYNLGFDDPFVVVSVSAGF
jgi:hypothetical protein